MRRRFSLRPAQDPRSRLLRRRPALERLETRALLSAGSLDPSFGTGGEVTTDFLQTDGFSAYNFVKQAAAQPDGRVVVAGPTSVDSADWIDDLSDFALARYNTDGSLDATFGTGGRVVTQFAGVSAYPQSIAVQTDGKILVAGLASDLRFQFITVAVARYDPDGSLDSSFGSGGREILSPELAFGSAVGLVVQPDGKIVIAGDASSSLSLARLNGDGSLDTSFGSGGVATTDFAPIIGALDGGTAGLALQPDGKIVAVGGDGQDFALVRYNPDGTVDTGFGAGGLVLTHFPGYASAGIAGVAIQPDGEIVAAGTVGMAYPEASPGDFALARYNPDGSLDTSFGNRGVVTTDLGQDDWINSVVLQSDGRIVVGGGTSDDFTADPSTTLFALARYNPDGSLDQGYGDGGIATAGFADGTYAEIRSLVLQPDNQVVAAGMAISDQGTQWDFGLARFLGGDLGVIDQRQASTQLGLLEGTVEQAGQSATIGFSVSDNAQLSDVIDAANRYDAAANPAGLPSGPVGSMTIEVDLAAGTYGGQTIDLWPGETVVLKGADGGTTTFVGHSPALTVRSGVVIARGVTFTNATDFPTVEVAGGTLTLRGCTVQESTGYDQVALQVTGGSVDLGTAADPGGDVINVNGSGSLVADTGPNPVAAVGVSFTVNASPVAPSSLSGVVFSDFNDDGQVDFGEQGIAGVTITLTGTDFLGHAVSLSQATDADGTYVFQGLLPGSYTITEVQQPAGYTPGIDSVGTAGGTVSGAQFTVALPAGVDGLNYNYGEQPAATGAIKSGQAAGIGFWNNRNGQALILALNGGPAGTQLGSWLAATFPHMFGSLSGGNDLAGESNAYVAALFQRDFVVHGVKLDAQVLATALAVYVTDATLDCTGVGTRYGFAVGGNGVATSTFNVGPDGAAFGAADDTTMTVMDLLLSVDTAAVNGVLYEGNTAVRDKANNVFSAINDAGSI
jgi:uncharacterized delta-60 repeat protein